MKVGYKVAALGSAILFVAFGALYLGKSASAASTVEITGSVKLDGAVPHQKPIDMAKEPSCAAVHKDRPATTESVVAGANGGLANVVVYITQGLTGSEPVSTQSVEINQKGCQYVPHVVAVDAGQHLKIVNSDQTSHNIYSQATKNPPWNKSQPSGAAPLDATWNNEEIAIPVKCNVHPWMHAYIVVVKGPYGVSGDDGSFKLDNVPPGDYTLTAWHETYGTQTQKVTVAAGKPATISFTFKAK
jgi:plastocyanin